MSGVAHIKAEFLLDKVEVSNEENETKGSEESLEPPTKKAKVGGGGRNKNRPWINYAPNEEKLCPRLWSVPVGTVSSKDLCTFEKCNFSHDAQSIIAKKSEDLGEECSAFKNYGKCRYGVICRFSSKHVDGVNNIINEELDKKYEENPIVVNNLSRDVQTQLRKKKYDLSKATAAAERIKKEVKNNNKAKNLNNGNTPNETDENNKNGAVTSDTKELLNGDKIGPADDSDTIKLKSTERKQLDWNDKLYLAPLTTLGNLPFRRVCKKFGADITCSEMAVSSKLLQGQMNEWALIKRHCSEDFFGVQLESNNVETIVKCTQLLSETSDSIDFIDINMGCPIDIIYGQGGGSALMRRQRDVEAMVKGMCYVSDIPITLKMRTGIYKHTNVAHNIIKDAKYWGTQLITVHGRSREQRYLKSADWEYIDLCAKTASPIPLYGNGDVYTYEDYNLHKQSNVAGMMIGRGALIKPWIFTEIKEQRHWDISSSERFDILKDFTNAGLEHWGSDHEGVEKTRRFMLEWLSFLYRYIPVGVLESTQSMNQRPLPYKGRDYLETLMASKNCADWIKISEMLLGKVPEDFLFLPKHKANAWS